jgi:hypothetical protein
MYFEIEIVFIFFQFFSDMVSSHVVHSHYLNFNCLGLVILFSWIQNFDTKNTKDILIILKHFRNVYSCSILAAYILEYSQFHIKIFTIIYEKYSTR